MPELKFTLPIQSVQSGKTKARFAKIGELNKNGVQKTIVGMFYEDTRKKEYKAFIRLQAIPQLRGFEPIVGCVETEFLFYFQRPLSHYVNNDRSRPLKANAPTKCMKTPDITDNACKGIADALTGFAWVDDKQITDHSAKKRWTNDNDYIILTFEAVEE
jgi:Holliday junction resolvase RusA-like endonuclease